MEKLIVLFSTLSTFIAEASSLRAVTELRRPRCNFMYRS